MVSIKEATANAVAFARDALGAERTKGVRLEEVESTTVAGKDAWLITLSMIAPPSDNIGRAFAEGVLNSKRDYRTFTVIKSDGEVKSMKIRELADA